MNKFFKHKNISALLENITAWIHNSVNMSEQFCSICNNFPFNTDREFEAIKANTVTTYYWINTSNSL
jgi:hypothetical protein